MFVSSAQGGEWRGASRGSTVATLSDRLAHIHCSLDTVQYAICNVPLDCRFGSSTGHSICLMGRGASCSLDSAAQGSSHLAHLLLQHLL